MVKSRKAGFSLVEIVLAVGIVSIALLAIFGMFGSSLQSNAETLSQHEVMGVTRSSADFLQSTNGAAGFTNVFGWVKTPSSAPEIYAYATANGTFAIGLGSNGTFMDDADRRPARLFRLALELSPNMPLRDATGELIPKKPSASDLPASAVGYTNDAVLALQIKAYSLPDADAKTNNFKPVFTYETTIRR